MLKPLPSPLMKPILVFVNPKSGGNQVGELIHLLFSYVLDTGQDECQIKQTTLLLNTVVIQITIMILSGLNTSLLIKSQQDVVR